MSLLKEVEYLKHENEKLKEQLKDSQGRIRVLKEEVGFAERGYTRKHHMTEEVTVNDIAALLEVSRRSAIQRMLDWSNDNTLSNLTCQQWATQHGSSCWCQKKAYCIPRSLLAPR
jgi:hypothetical protein